MVALIISIQIQILFMFHWWWSASSTCVMWFVRCTSFDVLKTCCMAVGSLHQHSFSFSAVHVYASSWLFSLCTCLWFTFLCSCTYWPTVRSTTLENTDNENLWMMQIIAMILAQKKRDKENSMCYQMFGVYQHGYALCVCMWTVIGLAPCHIQTNFFFFPPLYFYTWIDL